MVGRLTEAEHSRIREAVRLAEATTSAEIRLVLAQASSRYEMEMLIYPSLAALITGGALAAIDPQLAAAMLFAVQGGIFVVLFGALHWPPLLHAILLPAIKRRAAAQQARLHYASLSLTHPHLRNAVLIYCSQAERYAEILVDDTIGEKLPQSHWTTILAGFRAAMAERRLTDAFVGAVEASAALLAPHFPATAGQSNILPDDLEEI